MEATPGLSAAIGNGLCAENKGSSYCLLPSECGHQGTGTRGSPPPLQSGAGPRRLKVILRERGRGGGL